MIANLELQEFADVLRFVLVPVSPLAPDEHIFGRDPQVREIEQALDSPGRTVFIYGDHEVGKSSLAQAVAAYQVALTRILKRREARQEDTPVVVDEFHQITSDEERIRFADFIREIGDRRIPIRFVFCAVSESVKKLLGAHESCYTQNIEWSRPDREVEPEIADTASDARKTRSPHHVYLVAENLFWEMFNDPTFAHSLG